LYIETPNKTDPQPARFWFEEDALVVLDPRYDIRVYYRPAVPSDVNSEKPLKGDLFTAIRLGNIDAVTSMTGANPSLVEKRRKGRISPLYWAVMWGQIDIVKLLIAKGADVNAKDEYGGTPLHQAAWHGFADIADLLISKGGNVNATNVLGASPLKLAQQLRQTNVVQILREHGGKE
jgi:hypothetical protein